MADRTVSSGFAPIHFSELQWPAHMLIDYVRVYQIPGHGKMGCDPADRPTAKYINQHLNAYTNPNLTTWQAAGYDKPVSDRSLLFVWYGGSLHRAG